MLLEDEEHPVGAKGVVGEGEDAIGVVEWEQVAGVGSVDICS